MFCNELVSIAEIARDVPADIVGSGHQQIHEVVDDDHNLGTIDRLKPNQPTDSHNRCTLHRGSMSARQASLRNARAVDAPQP